MQEEKIKTQKHTTSKWGLIKSEPSFKKKNELSIYRSWRVSHLKGIRDTNPPIDHCPQLLVQGDSKFQHLGEPKVPSWWREMTIKVNRVVITEPAKNSKLLFKIKKIGVHFIKNHLLPPLIISSYIKNVTHFGQLW